LQNERKTNSLVCDCYWLWQCKKHQNSARIYGAIGRRIR
jgi:hypothetical protein